MAWTNGSGVIVADERGWTAAAKGFCYNLKRWGNGQRHSGGAGNTSRPYHVIQRALAAVGVEMRKRAAGKEKDKK